MSGWLQNRSSLEKVLISFSCLLLITLILMISILGGGSPGGEEGETPLCLSKECIQMASQMMSKMEENWNPCSNFYEYACGGRMNNSGLEPSSASRTVDVLLKNLLENSEDWQPAESLYRRCTEFGGVQEGGNPDDVMKELMKQFSVGTWPVVDTFFDVDSELSLDERLAGVALLGIPLAYKIEVTPGNSSSSPRLLKISAGGPQMSGMSPEEIRGDVKLLTHLVSSFYLLGAAHSRILTDARDILEVDTWYAGIHQASECRTVDQIAAEEAAEELNRLIPESDWSVLLRAIQRAAGVTSPFRVELHCKERIRDYIQYLKDLINRSAYNYIGWRFYSAFEKHIISEFHHLQRDDNLRWADCTDLLLQHAPHPLLSALAAYYLPLNQLERIALAIDDRISRHFNVDRKNRRRLFDELIELLRRGREEQPKRKGAQLLQVDASNYTSVVIELRRQSFLKELRKLGQVEDPEDVSEDLRRLLFSLLSTKGLRFAESSEWFSYGTLGPVLSAELHGKLFLARWKECGDCQEEDNQVTNDDSFMKEAFINICAVRFAYESLKNLDSKEDKLLPGMTSNLLQKFFIAYAQTFCDGDEAEEEIHQKRLNSLVDHSASFRRTFDCKEEATKTRC